MKKLITLALLVAVVAACSNGDDSGDQTESGSDMLGYLTGRLNFRYKISPRSNLLIGLEYTYFFDAINFYGKFTNTFNGNIQKEISTRGNKMSMLGISAGITL